MANTNLQTLSSVCQNDDCMWSLAWSLRQLCSHTQFPSGIAGRPEAAINMPHASADCSTKWLALANAPTHAWCRGYVITSLAGAKRRGTRHQCLADHGVCPDASEPMVGPPVNTKTCLIRWEIPLPNADGMAQPCWLIDTRQTCRTSDSATCADMRSAAVWANTLFDMSVTQCRKHASRQWRIPSESI